MERTELGEPATSSVASAENDADRLAFELLAPSEQVTREAESYPSDERRDATVRLLTETYGLPSQSALRYATALVPEQRPSDSLLRRLGLLF